MAYKQKPKPLSKPRELAKHEHRHYWPYLPAVILSIGVMLALFLSTIRASHVLGSSAGISPDGLLSSTNSARTDQSTPSLRSSAKLARAAQDKANDMVKRDYWSHNTPEGKSPWTFVDKSGYAYKSIGENLAYGFSEDQEVINGWLNSPAHRDNLLNTSYKEVGFGIATSEDFQGNGPETVVVALYATPGPAATTTATVLGDASSDQTFGITRVETLFGSSGQSAAFLAGAVITAATMFLLMRHVALLRSLARRSESFVLHHPVLDVALVALCIVGVFLAQTSGFVR